MKRAVLDLMREVLDHEIVDADGVTCGMVDDIAFEHDRRGVPRPAYLLVGAGAWNTRLPAVIAVQWRKLHRGVVRVAWSEVTDISEVVRLRSSASALGLGNTDRKVGRWLRKLPRS